MRVIVVAVVIVAVRVHVVDDVGMRRGRWERREKRRVKRRERKIVAIERGGASAAIEHDVVIKITTKCVVKDISFLRTPRSVGLLLYLICLMQSQELRECNAVV